MATIRGADAGKQEQTQRIENELVDCGFSDPRLRRRFSALVKQYVSGTSMHWRWRLLLDFPMRSPSPARKGTSARSGGRKSTSCRQLAHEWKRAGNFGSGGNRAQAMGYRSRISH